MIWMDGLCLNVSSWYYLIFFWMHRCLCKLQVSSSLLTRLPKYCCAFPLEGRMLPARYRWLPVLTILFSCVVIKDTISVDFICSYDASMHKSRWILDCKFTFYCLVAFTSKDPEEPSCFWDVAFSLEPFS